jgi:phosphatidylserine synthase
MKIDLIVQSLLLAVLLLGWFFSGLNAWMAGPLLVLVMLQMVSALQLWSVYKFQPAQSFVWVGLAILLLFVCCLPGLGVLSWFLPLGLVFAYYFQTISRLVIVFRRPKSFWDLL